MKQFQFPFIISNKQTNFANVILNFLQENHVQEKEQKLSQIEFKWIENKNIQRSFLNKGIKSRKNCFLE